MKFNYCIVLAGFLCSCAQASILTSKPTVIPASKSAPDQAVAGIMSLKSSKDIEAAPPSYGVLDISGRYRYGIIEEKEIEEEEEEVEEEKPEEEEEETTNLPKLKKGYPSTLQVMLGYTTPKFFENQAYIQIRSVSSIGRVLYNDGLNNQKRAFEADPRTTEIDQVYLDIPLYYSSSIRVGRHKKNLSNERFIGSSSWRQNHQSFDGVTINSSPFPAIILEAGYYTNVHRPYTDKSSHGNFRHSNIYVISIQNNAFPEFSTHCYGMACRFGTKKSPLANTLSNITFGARFSGVYKWEPEFAINYWAEIAAQRPLSNNRKDFAVHYGHLQGGAQIYNFNFTTGYEILSSDQNQGFMTPLGSTGKFNGWTGKFFSIPAVDSPPGPAFGHFNGLRDLYFRVRASIRKNIPIKLINNIELEYTYHYFSSYGRSKAIFYGVEHNALINFYICNFAGDSINDSIKDHRGNDAPDTGPHWKIQLKFARYEGHKYGLDSTKFWLSIIFKY